MEFPQLPPDQIGPLLRHKIEQIDTLGGDTRFFRFAAHAPHIVELYWGHFYRDVFFKGVLPVRLKEIARLRLAALNGCSFCQVGDRQSALAHGVTEAEVDALFAHGQSPTFSPAEQAADPGRGVNDPGDFQLLLIEVAVGAEVFGEPKLIEVPHRIGDEPAQQQQPGSPE